MIHHPPPPPDDATPVIILISVVICLAINYVVYRTKRRIAINIIRTAIREIKQ